MALRRLILPLVLLANASAGMTLAGEAVDVIASVDIQTIAAYSLLKDHVLSRSEVGDYPQRFLHRFGGSVAVALSVHPTATDAGSFLARVRKYINAGTSTIEGLGDDASASGANRFDFRQDNVVVTVFGQRDVAESIGAALRTRCPKGKETIAPKIVKVDIPRTARSGQPLRFTVSLSDMPRDQEIRFAGAFPIEGEPSRREGDIQVYTLEQMMPVEKGPFELDLSILAPGSVVIEHPMSIDVR